MRERVQDPVPAGCGERQGALAGGDGLIILAPVAELKGQKDRDLSSRRGSSRVTARASASCRYARMRLNRPKDRAPSQRAGDRWPAPGWRASLADAAGHRAPVRSTPGPRGRPTVPGLCPLPAGSTPGPCPTCRPAGHGGPGVRPGPSDFHLKSFVSRLGQLVASEGFQGHDNPGMEGAPPLLEQCLVGHLLGEGVFEGVLDLGEQTHLVKELAAWRWVSPRWSGSSGTSAMAWRSARVPRCR